MAAAGNGEAEDETFRDSISLEATSSRFIERSGARVETTEGGGFEKAATAIAARVLMGVDDGIGSDEIAAEAAAAAAGAGVDEDAAAASIANCCFIEFGLANIGFEKYAAGVICDVIDPADADRTTTVNAPFDNTPKSGLCGDRRVVTPILIVC